jgi:hypothetical protein
MPRRLLLIAAALFVIALAAWGVVASMADPDTNAQGPGPSATPAPGASSSPAPTRAATTTENTEGLEEDFGDEVVGIATGSTSAAFDDGLEVTLVSVTGTETTGSGVGAVNGPAFVVTIELVNTSDSKADLSAFVINAYTGKDNAPATLAGDDPASKPFGASLKAGGTTRGSYVFGVADTGDSLTVTVSTSVDSGLVVLQYR